MTSALPLEPPGPAASVAKMPSHSRPMADRRLEAETSHKKTRKSSVNHGETIKNHRVSSDFSAFRALHWIPSSRPMGHLCPAAGPWGEFSLPRQRTGDDKLYFHLFLICFSSSSRYFHRYLALFRHVHPISSCRPHETTLPRLLRPSGTENLLEIGLTRSPRSGPLDRLKLKMLA